MKEFKILYNGDVARWKKFQVAIDTKDWVFKATSANRAIDLFMEKVINIIETEEDFASVRDDVITKLDFIKKDLKAKEL